MKNGTSVFDLDYLIEAALNGHPYNQQRLGFQAQRYAASISWQVAPDLPEDLHGDVFSEAFKLVLEAGVGALANKSGKELFAGAVRNAVRRIQAAYAPPGQRTRKAAPLKSRIAPEHVEHVLDPEALERASIGAGKARHIDFDAVADPEGQAPLRLVENKIDIQKLLAHAPALVERSCREIYLEGLSSQASAEKAGITRFKLRRDFIAFAEDVQAAA